MAFMRAKTLFLAAASLLWLDSHAQYAWQRGVGVGEARPLSNVQYEAEFQGSFSSGATPLWLNANRHGLSSLASNNGYLRGAL